MVKRDAATDAPEWEWDEMKVVRSDIQGFGVFPKKNKNLNWENLSSEKGAPQLPVIMPFIGQECESDSAFTSRLLLSVLLGHFDPVRLSDIPKEDGAKWLVDGLCLVSITDQERQHASEEFEGCEELTKFLNDNAELYKEDAGDPEVLQVAFSVKKDSNGISNINLGESSVAYMLKREVMSLLQIPDHLFALLEMHSEHSHVDRHLATHILEFSRSRNAHILINAHPLFQNSAFIMGIVNEPQTNAPNLKIMKGKVWVLPDDDPMMQKHGLKQNPRNIDLWKEFHEEFPEMCDTNMFYITNRTAFDLNKELTVSYGASYKRTYKTFGVKGKKDAIDNVATLLTVPKDVFSESTVKEAKWPNKVPGWFNTDLQPENRPAFVTVEDGDNQKIEVAVDLPELVRHRKLMIERPFDLYDNEDHGLPGDQDEWAERFRWRWAGVCSSSSSSVTNNAGLDYCGKRAKLKRGPKSRLKPVQEWDLQRPKRYRTSDMSDPRAEREFSLTHIIRPSHANSAPAASLWGGKGMAWLLDQGAHNLVTSKVAVCPPREGFPPPAPKLKKGATCHEFGRGPRDDDEDDVKVDIPTDDHPWDFDEDTPMADINLRATWKMLSVPVLPEDDGHDYHFQHAWEDGGYGRQPSARQYQEAQPRRAKRRREEKLAKERKEREAEEREAQELAEWEAAAIEAEEHGGDDEDAADGEEGETDGVSVGTHSSRSERTKRQRRGKGEDQGDVPCVSQQIANGMSQTARAQEGRAMGNDDIVDGTPCATTTSTSEVLPLCIYITYTCIQIYANAKCPK
jgi:hypothetical protein